MTLPTVDDANYPTADELRDGALRTIVAGYRRRGIDANVLPGSDHYFRHEAMARRAAIAFANLETILPRLSPKQATGDYLVELAAVFGIEKRAATKSTGTVTLSISGSASVTIPIGYVCTSASGVKYETTETTVGAVNGDAVTVEAQDDFEGSQGDLEAGAVLTWDSASVGFLDPTCTTVAGLSGGADEDDEETLRERLYDRLSFPQGGGNAAQVKAWAEESSASVEKAYVYCAVRGPGSVDVAVTSTSADRTLSGTGVTAVESYIETKTPGHEDINVTTVTPRNVDVLVDLRLPKAVAAGGSGGGWYDSTPWPSGSPTMGTNDGKVTLYVAPTATVRATTSPVVGQRIAIWDPTKSVTINGVTGTFGGFREYTISVVGGVSGAYTIQVLGGFIVSPFNSYVSPGAARMADYGSTFLAAFRLLGPGEKTSSLDILPRGRRQLATDVANPSAISSQLFAELEDAYTEIADLSWGARVDTGTTTARTEPVVPANTTAPPEILVLKYLAFRAMT